MHLILEVTDKKQFYANVSMSLLSPFHSGYLPSAIFYSEYMYLQTGTLAISQDPDRIPDNANIIRVMTEMHHN